MYLDSSSLYSPIDDDRSSSNGPSSRSNPLCRFPCQWQVLLLLALLQARLLRARCTSCISTFQQNTTHQRAQNQDLLKSRPKCISLVRTSLSASPPRSCVIDNTNRDISTRSLYLALKVDFPHVRFRCFHFVASEEMARHNSVFRSLYPKEGEDRREVLPGIAFSSYAKGFEEPRMEEGMDAWRGVADTDEGNRV